MGIIISDTRPNRITSENKNTDEAYHLKQSRWAVGQGTNNSAYNKWIENIKINKSFTKGDQWIDKEDSETFLSDSSGQTRNRIKVVFNQVRPIVEQYRGNASILKMNASAKSISKLSVNRRELELSKKIMTTKLAEEFPGLGEIMRKNDESIGKDVSDTMRIFENLYIDMYVPQINSLLNFGAENNRYEQMQMPIALNLALTGAVFGECFNHGGHRRTRILESEDCFYDTDSRMPDMSDASFIGYRSPMDISFIAEKYQINKETLDRLESYNNEMLNSSNGQYSGLKPNVYRVYWKDVSKWEYGYVLDDSGYPLLTKINFTYPGEESPRYTDEDLIDPPKSDFTRRIFKNKKKKSLYFDEVRFCDFIASEDIGGIGPSGEKNKDITDIVLRYGLLEYQETDSMDFSNVKFPIKVQTWGFIDGEIYSPVDDAISPQRLINRIMSVTEGHINNSGGQGTVIDEDSINPDDKDDIGFSMKEGKTVFVQSKGKGVPNIIGRYDNTPGKGIYDMFGIIPTLQQNLQQVTGVNEGLKGQSMGNDQLVGVTELMIQRGSLMQEPFYAAISNLFIDFYQDMATVGKRYYIDNERELAIISGDEGAQILRLSKDMKNEDFRVFITRENDNAMLKSQANQMLQLFLELQLIDDRVFGNLYGRSTPDEVTMALRSQAGLRAEAKRKAEIEGVEQEQQMQQQAMIAQETDRQDKMTMHNDQVDLQRGSQELKQDEMLLKSLKE